VITGFYQYCLEAGTCVRCPATVNGTAATIAGAAQTVYVDVNAGADGWQYAKDGIVTGDPQRLP